MQMRISPNPRSPFGPEIGNFSSLVPVCSYCFLLVYSLSVVELVIKLNNAGSVCFTLILECQGFTIAQAQLDPCLPS